MLTTMTTMIDGMIQRFVQDFRDGEFIQSALASYAADISRCYDPRILQ